MARVYLLPLLLAMACAHVDGQGTTRRSGNRAAAQRIYLVAEERYAAGAFDEAAALMRHSLLQLPPSPEHDELRHELVLRMAHTQLRAHAATQQTGPLHDAQQMLVRYLERHEQLFGDGEKARAQRGEVYELLHLVERQLEPVVDEAVVTALDEVGEPSDPIPEDTGSFYTLAAAVQSTLAGTAAGPAPDEVTEPEPTPTARPAAQRTDADGNEVRDVVVPKQRRLPSIDDPGMKEKLRSPFSTGWLGGVLTAYGVTKMRDARALVRGHSRLAGDGDLAQKQLARRAGQSLLRGARAGLRECFMSAYARQPISELQNMVEASIHPDGTISHVSLVDGSLIDGYGDACMIEALQGTTVEPLSEPTEPVRVQVALTFLYESALYINELTGEQVHEGGIMLSPAAPPLQGLPRIDRFVKQ
jgi:hypothetical protein